MLETDGAALSRGFLEKISEVYGVSADWLLHGIGDPLQAPRQGFAGRTPERRIEEADTSVPLSGDFRFKGEDFALIERADLSVSAGFGVIPVEGGQRDAVAFSRSWLLEHQIAADLAVMVRVKGDSMAQTIPDGAFVLLDLSQRGPVTKAGIYAFNRGEASFVKRLVPSAPDARGRPGSIAVLSDNPSFPAENLVGDEMNQIKVIGRVRCVIASV